MSDIRKEYEYASGVDLDHLNPEVSKRDKGYLGEYLVFEKLYQTLSFPVKFLMNVEIPIQNRTTEIDMLMLCPYGVVCFEIKHFSGKVFGTSDDTCWTQAFKARKNEIFRNPFLQNDYHLSALKKLFPNIPFFSAVVLANPAAQCQIKVKRSDVLLSGLYDLSFNLTTFLTDKPKIFLENEMEDLFEKFIPYSKIKDRIEFQSEDMPLNIFINRLCQEKVEARKKLRKSRRRYALISAFCCLIFVVMIGFFSWFTVTQYQVESDRTIEAYRAEAENALREVSQVREYVTENDYRNHGDLSFLNGAFYIDHLILKKSTLIADTLLFGCEIVNNTSEYSFSFEEGAEAIVGFSDGKVETYPLPTVSSSIGILYANPGQKTTISSFEIYNVTADRHIEYIKINRMAIYKGSYTGLHSLLDDQLTITVYSN